MWAEHDVKIWWLLLRLSKKKKTTIKLHFTNRHAIGWTYLSYQDTQKTLKDILNAQDCIIFFYLSHSLRISCKGIFPNDPQLEAGFQPPFMHLPTPLPYPPPTPQVSAQRNDLLCFPSLESPSPSACPLHTLCHTPYSPLRPPGARPNGS